MSFLILSFFGGIWALWVLYVFTMGIYRLHLNKELKGLNAVMAWPIVVVAYLVDIVVNLTIVSILFLDLPKEFTTTDRLQRYLIKEATWRTDLAFWICDNLLDIFDPRGKHC